MGNAGGDGVRRRTGMPKVAKPRPDAITPRKRRAFLDALALTCNLRMAARFAGFHVSSAHRLRHEDPTFGVEWQAALEMGYDRLEALALEDCGAGGRIEPDPERAAEAGADPARFDFDKALRLLKFHRAAREGQRQAPRGGAPMKNMTREETNTLLLKALAAAKKRVERAQAEVAAATDAAEAGSHDGYMMSKRDDE